MIPETLLLLATLSSGIVDAGAAHSGIAMSENDSRLETNPALLGSDSLDRGLHARLTLVNMRIPLQAWNDISPQKDLILRGNANEILSSDAFLDDLWAFDGRPMSIRYGFGLAVWQGDWAASFEAATRPGVRVDHGAVIPSMETWDSCDIHVRGGVSQPFGDWRVGVGLHLRGQTGSVMTVNLRDPTRLGQEVKALRDSAFGHITGLGTWSAGVDLGALWKLPYDFQVGGKLGDLGLMNTEGDPERPALDLGAAWIPSRFRAGPRWARRLAVGMELRDLCNTTMPALGHLDLGIQVRHNLTPRAFEFRTATGLRGGWPSGGLGFTMGPLLLDAAAWVEDLDPVLGRTPLQNWEFQAQLGW